MATLPTATGNESANPDAEPKCYYLNDKALEV